MLFPFPSDNADAWYAKADLEYSLGKLQEAAASYKAALKIIPDSYEIWHNLAQTCFEMADWLDALEAYDNCLRINSLDASSFYEKAKINFILRRTKEAVDCLKSAFLIDPGFKNEFEKEYPDIKSSKLYEKLLGGL